MGFRTQAVGSSTGTRAVSPVIGVIMMVAIVVILSGVVGTIAFGLGDNAGEGAPQASLSVDVDAAADTITIQHTGGTALHSDSTRIEWQIAGASLTTRATGTNSVLIPGKEFTFLFDGSANATGSWTAYPSPGVVDIQPTDTVRVTVVDVDSGQLIYSAEINA